MLFEIFSHLEAGGADEVRLHSQQYEVSQIALMCKKLLRFAQCQLWATMDRVLPLLKLFLRLTHFDETYSSFTSTCYGPDIDYS